MKKIILLVTALTFVLPVFILNAEEMRTLYLVRHAEKLADHGSDPALTEQGKIRALNLAQQLKDDNIIAVYTTDYQRTRQTAQPLCDLLGLKARLYDPRDLPTFAQQLKSTSGNLLIVGHSNTTPELVELLSGESQPAMDESVYDRLYQLRLEAGQIKVKVLTSQPAQ